MIRQTGQYCIARASGEEVRAFVPYPLPPAGPPLMLDGPTMELLASAQTELARLAVAGSIVPSLDWFLFGFVRRGAVITSQIEGTRSTLAAVQLLDHLPSNPVITVSRASELLGMTAPPTRKAIKLLESIGILGEITGGRRNRAYAYQEYLKILAGDEE